jgi:2-polyprenyl-3-methyl-5-hydroxy-6-metoxy-1,4-benzoquinol methylase
MITGEGREGYQMVENIESLSDEVKRQMNRPEIHRTWERRYRTEENERFHEVAYDYFTKRLGQPEGSHALDIGCGVCANSIRLARRGYRVSAVDYSESILEPARSNVSEKGLADRITINRGDILDLAFPAEHFDLVLCWGVLMHIPDVERALDELIRVTKHRGFLVFEELNSYSPEALMMRAYWRIAKRKKIKITRPDAGYEHTCAFEGETLFWRQADLRWLMDYLTSHSCTLFGRSSAACSELYGLVPFRRFDSAIHGWNRFWLRNVNIPQLAYHNILMFHKD